MISGQTTNNNSCFPNVSQGLQIYNPLNGREDIVGSSSINEASSSMEISSHSNSLLYSLSLLKDKVNQVQSLVSILVSPAGQTEPESTSSLAIARMGTMIQEIIVTASSMVFTCQQMANHNTDQFHHQAPHHANKVQENVLLQSNFGGNNIEQDRGQSYFSSEAFEWYGDNYNDNNNNNRDLAVISSNNKIEKKELSHHNKESVENIGEEKSVLFKNYDIIELDASDLLAKYTHYCQVCGKGFKRDANLRMHMRAHGDEFKTNAALSNPMKNSSRDGEDESNNWTKLPRKYSCPQEGCRWNKKHAKFQPLKSMICVKNHYKRSHCPKMYVCKRCNRKQFSVLSDLRTHEKHCGDLKWQCSCGTTFSRKDKLVGHVALFIGHTPAINNNNNNTSFTKPAAATKVKNQAIQMQQEDRG